MSPQPSTAAAGKRKANPDDIQLLDAETLNMLTTDGTKKDIPGDGVCKRMEAVMRVKAVKPGDMKAMADRLFTFAFRLYCEARIEDLDRAKTRRPKLFLGDFHERSVKRRKVKVPGALADDDRAESLSRQEELEEAINNLGPMDLWLGDSQSDLHRARESLLRDLCNHDWKVLINRKHQWTALTVKQATSAVDYFLTEVFGQQGRDALGALVNEMHKHAAKGPTRWKDAMNARSVETAVRRTESLPAGVRRLCTAMCSVGYMETLATPQFARIASVLRLEERYLTLHFYHDAKDLLRAPTTPQVQSDDEDDDYRAAQLKVQRGLEADRTHLEKYIQNADGRNSLEKLHNTIAYDLTPKGHVVDTKAIIRDLRRGDFLYALVTMYGGGIIPLLPDTVMSRWIKDFPCGLFAPTIQLVIRHFPQTLEICQIITACVTDRMSGAFCPELSRYRTKAHRIALLPAMTADLKGEVSSKRLKEIMSDIGYDESNIEESAELLAAHDAPLDTNAETPNKFLLRRSQALA